LSDRQKEIAKLLAKGMTNREIAKALGLSPSTIKNHNEIIYLKIGAENRTQAALILTGRTK
jgi:DNA-binding NarL/FixJ family response regulator